ncbi:MULTISPECIES: hypothetical protein [Bacillus]|uniref:hypothetical protein n=1 Tax=Bacillus TaxID=1386 RepID=UPI00041222AF|nr:MULTISPECIES: hypothetical protein [Bacillus]QHZ45606.1 hypothetical protein M654_004425 [Bacillus sp. NSP9.1]WFA04590.1 hypothetical protein P3X63_18620 [Bacillus sp. HSf4]
MDKMIYDAVNTLTGNDTLLGITITCFFIFTIWLSRQTKTIYENEKELRKTQREQSLHIFSEIIEQYHLIESGDTIEKEKAFLAFIETKLPLLDFKSYINIRNILDDEENCKPKRIKKEIVKATKLIKIHENTLYSESILETFTRMFSILKDSFIPPIISVIAVLYLTLATVLSGDFWGETKLVAAIILVLLLIACFDDILEKRRVLVNRKSVFILLFSVYLPLILLFSIPTSYHRALVISFIYSILGILIFIGINIYKEIKSPQNRNRT